METRINARIDKDLKAEAEQVLAQLGLNTTDLIKLTFRQLVMRQGLPFDVKIPNDETVAALSEDLTDAPSFSSVDDLMADLHSRD
ncbi:MAG: type II toxin-antitoxin system RelB/DinJ family antitoxin [Hyphomicrobiales bacterium]|uniref:type II toxin-antitoxin system RelB/DinJ family antitoxin n=1 Tax=Roseobacteraceae TaxID=2854170 RepID=UPI00327F5D84